MNLEQKIEAILFFKNEPVSIAALSKWLGEEKEAVQSALASLGESLEGRGILVVFDGENAALGTHPDASALIESLQKEEFSRELGRAGLETLAIILYKGPISRREIDHIRGVNSGFILRNLLVRGLIEKTESIAGERSFSYKPTLELFEHLGVTRKEDLPDYGNAFKKVEEFTKANPIEQTEEHGG